MKKVTIIMMVLILTLPLVQASHASGNGAEQENRTRLDQTAQSLWGRIMDFFASLVPAPIRILFALGTNETQERER